MQNVGVGSCTWIMSNRDNLFVQKLVHEHRNCILRKSFCFFQTAITVCMLEGLKQGEYHFLTNKEKYQQWTHVKAPPTSHRHQPVKLTARSTQHPKLTKVTEGGLKQAKSSFWLMPLSTWITRDQPFNHIRVELIKTMERKKRWQHGFRLLTVHVNVGPCSNIASRVSWTFI